MPGKPTAPSWERATPTSPPRQVLASEHFLASKTEERKPPAIITRLLADYPEMTGDDMLYTVIGTIFTDVRTPFTQQERDELTDYCEYLIKERGHGLFKKQQGEAYPYEAIPGVEDPKSAGINFLWLKEFWPNIGTLVVSDIEAILKDQSAKLHLKEMAAYIKASAEQTETGKKSEIIRGRVAVNYF